MAPPAFRLLAAPDLDQVIDVVVRCDLLISEWAPAGWALPDGHRENERREWTEDLESAEFRCEVATDASGVIVGASATRPGKPGKDAATGHVGSLFVEPALQGQGIGRTLLTRAELWLRAHGHAKATLNVLERSPAIGFYLGLGWEPSGIRGRFEPFGLPTIRMTKRLRG